MKPQKNDGEGIYYDRLVTNKQAETEHGGYPNFNCQVDTHYSHLRKVSQQAVLLPDSCLQVPASRFLL